MKQATPLILFFVVVVLFAALFEGAAITLGTTSAFITGLMWSVAISAMLALKLSGRSLKSLGWSWGPARYHAIAFFLPAVYAGISYAIAAATGVITFGAPDPVSQLIEGEKFQTFAAPLGLLAAVVVTVTIGMAQSMATGLGEEIGWRGFLTPRLTALLGFVAATLITGAIWASWHLPLLFFGNYHGPGDQTYEFVSFFILVVAIAGPFAWLRLASGSLWPAATLHASHNIIIPYIFDALTTARDPSITMVGETGLITAAMAIVVSLPFWIMGARAFTRSTAAAQLKASEA